MDETLTNLLLSLLLQDAGRLRALEVDASTTVAELAKRLEACDASFAGGDRFLLFGGRPLHSTRTLEDCGVADLATMDARRRLRGGCFSISIMLWIVIFVCCLVSVCTCGLSLPVALFLLPFALLLPLCCL